MGVLKYIAKQKAQFQDYTVKKRKEMIMKKTEKVRAENVRQAELTKASQELAESRQIQRDLKEARGPSSVQKFGQGLASVMNKAKQAQKAMPGIGIPQVKSSKALDSSVKANTFGGSNLSLGGGSLNFGPTPKKKPMPKKRPRVIVEL